jgi:hypothetical protein
VTKQFNSGFSSEREKLSPFTKVFRGEEQFENTSLFLSAFIGGNPNRNKKSALQNNEFGVNRLTIFNKCLRLIFSTTRRDTALRVDTFERAQSPLSFSRYVGPAAAPPGYKNLFWPKSPSLRSGVANSVATTR